MRGWVRVGVAVLVAVAPVVAVPATGQAWSWGFNRVQTAAEDPAASVGYGPGWVGLSYKANGPIVGYLFGRDFRFADGSVKPSFDHMDIRGSRDFSGGHPTITRWPWGYGHGGFDGCAYGYGTSKFAIERSTPSSPSCANGPNAGPNGTWWHSEQVFCTTHSVDRMCSPVGVWAENKPPGNSGTLPVTSLGCEGFGNIGAAAAYGSGAAVPAHRVGSVPAGQRMDVRYVTRNRQWVMAKWYSGNLISGIEWAFFPRTCVQ